MRTLTPQPEPTASAALQTSRIELSPLREQSFHILLHIEQSARTHWYSRSWRTEKGTRHTCDIPTPESFTSIRIRRLQIKQLVKIQYAESYDHTSVT